ncbi:hypothetical protein ACWDUM_21145 [Rhodococcus sp. NPDC003322]
MTRRGRSRGYDDSWPHLLRLGGTVILLFVLGLVLIALVNEIV